MTWASLKLWAEDEEERILKCIVEALRRLITSRCISTNDGELAISGKLRPYLYRVKKDMKLVWTLHPEASSFLEEDTPKPIGHPDFRFSHNTPTYEQYDYDIECKLVRVKREGKSRDYCEYYVTHGIQRFQSRIYAQSSPPMGTMIGYIQEGDILFLLDSVNNQAKSQRLNKIGLKGAIENVGVTYLKQPLHRDQDNFVLSHLWVDLR